MFSVRTWLQGAVAVAALATAVAVAPGTASAVILNGSVAIGSAGFIPGAGDTLLSSITISPGNEQFGAGTNDFSGLTGTPISDAGFNITSLATLETYSFTSAGPNFGFITSGAFTAVRTAHVLAVELIGTVTQGGQSAPGALLATFGQVGGPGTTISYSATLTTTIPAIPEPMTLAVLGTGLLGLGLARRRAS